MRCVAQNLVLVCAWTALSAPAVAEDVSVRITLTGLFGWNRRKDFTKKIECTVAGWNLPRMTIIPKMAITMYSDGRLEEPLRSVPFIPGEEQYLECVLFSASGRKENTMAAYKLPDTYTDEQLLHGLDFEATWAGRRPADGKAFFRLGHQDLQVPAPGRTVDVSHRVGERTIAEAQQGQEAEVVIDQVVFAIQGLSGWSQTGSWKKMIECSVEGPDGSSMVILGKTEITMDTKGNCHPVVESQSHSLLSDMQTLVCKLYPAGSVVEEAEENEMSVNLDDHLADEEEKVEEDFVLDVLWDRQVAGHDAEVAIEVRYVETLVASQAARQEVVDEVVLAISGFDGWSAEEAQEWQKVIECTIEGPDGVPMVIIPKREVTMDEEGNCDPAVESQSLSVHSDKTTLVCKLFPAGSLGGDAIMEKEMSVDLKEWFSDEDLPSGVGLDVELEPEAGKEYKVLLDIIPVERPTSVLPEAKRQSVTEWVPQEELQLVTFTVEGLNGWPHKKRWTTQIKCYVQDRVVHPGRVEVLIPKTKIMMEPDGTLVEPLTSSHPLSVNSGHQFFFCDLYSWASRKPYNKLTGWILTAVYGRLRAAANGVIRMNVPCKWFVSADAPAPTVTFAARAVTPEPVKPELARAAHELQGGCREDLADKRCLLVGIGSYT